VLFIDEAYSLYRDDDSRDYGRECIDILLQVMENDRDKLVVILAGYGDKDRMDRFFESNPGMRSRIAHHLDFAAYQTPRPRRHSAATWRRSGHYRSSPTRAASATRWKAPGSGTPTASTPTRTGHGARTT
jgi:hypothetical protein